VSRNLLDRYDVLQCTVRRGRLGRFAGREQAQQPARQQEQLARVGYGMQPRGGAPGEHGAERSRAVVAGRRNLDLVLSARRSSESELRRVIDTKGFCAKRERYDPFRHNAWILTE